MNINHLIASVTGTSDSLDRTLHTLSELMNTTPAQQLIDLKQELSELLIDLHQLKVEWLNQSVDISRLPIVRQKAVDVINAEGVTYVEKVYDADYFSVLAPLIRKEICLAFSDWYVANKKETPLLFSTIADNNGVMSTDSEDE